MRPAVAVVYVALVKTNGRPRGHCPILLRLGQLVVQARLLCTQMAQWMVGPCAKHVRLNEELGSQDGLRAISSKSCVPSKKCPAGEHVRT